MPAAAVIRRIRALSGVTGRKELRRWFNKRIVKSGGSTIQTIIRTVELEDAVEVARWSGNGGGR